MRPPTALHRLKYELTCILAKYPPTLAGLKAAMPEIRQRWPGTRRRRDVLTVPGLGVVDVRDYHGEHLPE